MRETPYGIKKRLQFIYREVAQRLNNLGDISKIRTLDIGCGTGELITIPLGSLGLPILGMVCPPESSPAIVLDWKIRKGAKDGQEIAFSGADNQQTARS